MALYDNYSTITNVIAPIAAVRHTPPHAILQIVLRKRSTYIISRLALFSPQTESEKQPPSVAQDINGDGFRRDIFALPPANPRPW